MGKFTNQFEDQKDLILHLEQGLPQKVFKGKGSQITIWGSCAHPNQPIAHLEIYFQGKAQTIGILPGTKSNKGANISPSEILRTSHKKYFWAAIEISPTSPAGNAEITLRAVLKNGQSLEQNIGQFEITDHNIYDPNHELRKTIPPARVAICMAVYNPPIELFTRQIQSIRQQTYRDWVCIISDDNSSPESRAKIAAAIQGDARFFVFPSQTRLGFYNNFERSLTLVPEGCEFVSLSDQDDYWYPQKLETLVGAFDNPDIVLAYSDMHIVNPAGELMALSLWDKREHKYDNLTSMVISNTVTGAAAMFRSTLLTTLLPMPPYFGNMYHDHWLGCVALAFGKIKFIDTPLYDYVQHQNNVIGYSTPRKRTILRTISQIGNTFRQITSAPIREKLFVEWRDIFLEDYLRMRCIALMLLLRSENKIPPGKSDALKRILRIHNSLALQTWFAIRGSRNKATLGAELFILKSLLWYKYAAIFG